MDIYSQCTTIVTLVFLLSDLICTTWADTDFDDLDMGIDLDVINSLASMLLDPDGAEDTGQQGECLYTCRNGEYILRLGLLAVELGLLVGSTVGSTKPTVQLSLLLLNFKRGSLVLTFNVHYYIIH